ncbi:MAG: energy transducer TonB [Sulfuricella sp.]
MPVLGLVLLAHAGAWYGLSHLRTDIQPPKPLPVIEVALLAPPPPPQPKIVPHTPEPPKPEPRPKIQRQANPAPRLPLPQQAEPALEQVAVTTPVAPTPPAPEAPAKSVPEPALEAPRFHAAYLNNPPPAYPMAARRRGIEGRVLVRAEVQTDGSCSRVELKTSSGSDSLDQAALEAVRKWRFIPARKGSQLLTAWVEVPITFKLEN